MATLALQNPEQAVRELERCVTKLGFKGVMVNGYTQVESPDNLIYLDDARMTPFWEALTALDVPLYLHPRASHKLSCTKTIRSLLARTGVLPRRRRLMRCASSTAASLIAFRRPSWCWDISARLLPFLAWRIQHGINFSPNGRSTKKRLVDYLAENIWVTTSGNFNTQALHCTI